MQQMIMNPGFLMPVNIQGQMFYMPVSVCPMMMMPKAMPQQQLFDITAVTNQQLCQGIKTEEECPSKQDTLRNETSKSNAMESCSDVKRGRVWTYEEKVRLLQLYQHYEGKWTEIVKHFKGRNISQCSQKYRKISNNRKLKKKWTYEEDQSLLKQIETIGKSWVSIARTLPGRSSKQVRDRYINKLDPKLKTSGWSSDEDEIIYQEYVKQGPKWTTIAEILKNRSENQVKNRFYYHVQAKYFGKKHEYLQSED